MATEGPYTPQWGTRWLFRNVSRRHRKIRFGFLQDNCPGRDLIVSAIPFDNDDMQKMFCFLLHLKLTYTVLNSASSFFKLKIHKWGQFDH